VDWWLGRRGTALGGSFSGRPSRTRCGGAACRLWISATGGPASTGRKRSVGNARHHNATRRAVHPPGRASGVVGASGRAGSDGIGGRDDGGSGDGCSGSGGRCSGGSDGGRLGGGGSGGGGRLAGAGRRTGAWWRVRERTGGGEGATVLAEDPRDGMTCEHGGAHASSRRSRGQAGK
jgi:hypothetical protein